MNLCNLMFVVLLVGSVTRANERNSAVAVFYSWMCYELVANCSKVCSSYHALLEEH